MKLSKILPAVFVLIVIGLFVWYSKANATNPKPKPTPPPVSEQSQHQKQEQGQHQGQSQNQNANADSSSSSSSDSSSHSESFSEGSDSSANNEGNSLSVNNEGSPADIVLVPQGHTSNCMRTYGISFGNREGGGGLGWPYRDKSCDFDGNATAADLQGNYDLGWFWRCQKKNSYKVFRSRGESVESAIEDCVARNSGPNFMSQLIEKQKAEITQLEKEREAALIVIQERDRLKEEIAEKRLVEEVSK